MLKRLVLGLCLTFSVHAPDPGELYNLFNEVWFGAPESRSVYSVNGFSVLCWLLEDPPEEEYGDDLTQEVLDELGESVPPPELFGKE